MQGVPGFQVDPMLQNRFDPFSSGLPGFQSKVPGHPYRVQEVQGVGEVQEEHFTKLQEVKEANLYMLGRREGREGRREGREEGREGRREVGSGWLGGERKPMEGQWALQAGATKQESGPGGWIPPSRVLTMYPHILSPYERTEIFTYPQIYFIGQRAAHSTGKIPGTSLSQPNYGFDDREGGYSGVTHDQIAYRYEILRPLGKGSFGQVLKVFDHKTQEFAAIKVVRNNKRFEKQATKEVGILEHLLREDPEGTNNVVHMKESFMFRGHACIVFELLSISLYDLIKKNKFHSFDQKMVKNFTHSILLALGTFTRMKVIHGDLKPENIVLRQTGKSGLKVIDFGSSCYEGSVLYSYVQSRYYRAPEVVLGAAYGAAIDMWSLGCIVAELLTGQPLLPGEDEADQLAQMVEVLGVPPPSLVARGRRAHRFLTPSGYPRYCSVSRGDGVEVVEGSCNRRGRWRGPPGSKDLRTALRQPATSPAADFVRRCLVWDPKERMTPAQGLHHHWLRGSGASVRPGPTHRG